MRENKGLASVESSDNEETYRTVQYNVERWNGTKQLQTESFSEREKIN